MSDKINRSASRGSVKILLMEDEEVIRKTVSRLLTRLGYEVETAGNGEETLDLYKNGMDTSRPFDIVMMDLTIHGGMGGVETMSRLLAIDPAVKAVISSGHFNDPVLMNYKKYGFSGVIAKPYEIEQLIDLLDKVIRSEDQ